MIEGFLLTLGLGLVIWFLVYALLELLWGDDDRS